MSQSVDLADVVLWDTRIGAVAWDRERGLGSFEYDSDFLRSGMEVSPLLMPTTGQSTYQFPSLGLETFHGLPGLLADALPDKFGNLLIDRWLAGQGRSTGDFSPVERLCYQGGRGMGALEFRPSVRRGRDSSAEVDVASLVGLANQVLADREGLQVRLDGVNEPEALADIIRVGTSAGGARAKAVVAWNERTGELRSGQVEAPRNFTQWLLKFDGVTGNRDKELADPQGFGRIEYAYYLMAKEAGIAMERCRLLEENGRSHFMTRRFDRPGDGEKIHMQSLCGLAHYDFNVAGGYSYEQALQVLQRLGAPREDLVEQFRRAVFNVVSRNQDDHTKNIAFLMDRRGNWRLSPAFDITYAYNPSGAWTSAHQMTVNGKRDGFDSEDLRALSRAGNLSLREFRNALAEVEAAVEQWQHYADQAGVDEATTAKIAVVHRRLV